MKHLLLSIIVTSLILLAGSCNRNANVVRELHYIDLLSPENKAFHKYPNEFCTYLLKGILEEEIEAYYIDYDSSGQTSSLPLTLFIQKILEPYQEYSVGESTDTDTYTMEDVYGFISSVTLLSFDELILSEEVHTNYINFYHPGDVTLEGIDKYICSVEFKSAMDFLNSKYSPLLWHNYRVEEWGWYNDRLFIPQFESSSRLAYDMLESSDSSFLSPRLSDTITFDKVMILANENPYFFSSRFDPTGEGKLNVIYKNDSILLDIATFTFEDITKVSMNKNRLDSVKIIPVTTAISLRKMKQQDRIKRISQNGKFINPLKGQDPLSKREPGKLNKNNIELPPSQKFYFRTIERLIGNEKASSFENLAGLLYEGVKAGSITVYQSDSLKSRLLPGDFFDNMILDQQDNIPAETRFLQVYQVITETVFEQSGKIEYRRPIGIGLILPGKQVPEGLNRPVGYFRLSDVNILLQSKGMVEISISELKGYPLKSSNIEVFQKN